MNERLPSGAKPKAKSNANLPRDAATLIIVDRRADGPHVLFGKRNASHRFMPNKFVFPGGAVEAADRRVAALTPLAAAVEAKLNLQARRPSKSLARALALAAIRETFEETGLVIGEPCERARAAPGPWGAFHAHGFAPALHALDYLARAITPPGRSKRFDARFFVVDGAHVKAQAPGIVHEGAELTELVWRPLAEADTLDLPGITRMVLADLRAALAEGFAPERARPFYREVRGTYRRELV